MTRGRRQLVKVQLVHDLLRLSCAMRCRCANATAAAAQADLKKSDSFCTWQGPPLLSSLCATFCDKHRRGCFVSPRHKGAHKVWSRAIRKHGRPSVKQSFFA